jgi:tRNA (guanine37-N1)-methyltransferase
MPISDAGPQLRIDIVSIFPEYLVPLELSLVGKAREAGQIDVRIHDLRDCTKDRHRTVDDTPYGGGPGMVMLPEAIKIPKPNPSLLLSRLLDLI